VPINYYFPKIICSWDNRFIFTTRESDSIYEKDACMLGSKISSRFTPVFINKCYTVSLRDQLSSTLKKKFFIRIIFSDHYLV